MIDDDRQTMMVAAGSPLPTLHVPDEPVLLRVVWRDRVLGGQALEQVLTGADGLVGWLWRRWRVLAGAGMSGERFESIVLEYRREIWLWMGGERTWEQCCAGLIGRLGRRLDQAG